MLLQREQALRHKGEHLSHRSDVAASAEAKYDASSSQPIASSELRFDVPTGNLRCPVLLRHSFCFCLRSCL